MTGTNEFSDNNPPLRWLLARSAGRSERQPPAQVQAGAAWKGPDLRMRCTTTEAAYQWPQRAPYDGGQTVTCNVPGYGSHALDATGATRQQPRALCGFHWTQREGRIVLEEPSCPECLREVQLGAERDRGGW